MSRLIDADELLTAFPIDDEPMLTKSCVRMTIRHMPTIEPQRWIPVSERLPNDGDRVIVQMLNGHICIIEFSAWGVTNHLAAWMPLPELYANHRATAMDSCEREIDRIWSKYLGVGA